MMQRSGASVPMGVMPHAIGGNDVVDDTATPEPTQSHRVKWREVAGVTGLLAGAVALALFASDGGILFTRALWVDEVHTVLVAERASPVSVIGDLASGADFGPPLVPLAAWALRRVAGELTPTVLRSASLVCVMGALLLVYAVLRRRFAVGASVAGVLAVGTQELVIAHSYEARFYGPWLLCVAFFAVSLASPQRRVRLAVASTLLCTVHWYGVFTLGLMLVAAVAVHGRRWRESLASLWPATAGLVALLLCVPLSIGQRNALSVATWVPDFTVSQLTALLGAFWGTPVPVAAMLAIVVGAAIRGVAHRRLVVTPVATAVRDPALAALFGLAVLPFALAVLSGIGQPSMLGRYNIPNVLVWAPLVALGAEFVGRWPARVMVGWLLWLWLPGYVLTANRKRAFDSGVRQASASFKAAAALQVPVVFSSMHALYAVAALDGTDRAALSFLELSDSTLQSAFGSDARFYQLNKGVRIERDVVRVHARRFGFPRIARQTELQTAPRVAIVAFDANLPRGYSSGEAYGRLLFPEHCLTTIESGISLFVRRAPLAMC